MTTLYSFRRYFISGIRLNERIPSIIPKMNVVTIASGTSSNVIPMPASMYLIICHIVIVSPYLLNDAFCSSLAPSQLSARNISTYITPTIQIDTLLRYLS